MKKAVLLTISFIVVLIVAMLFWKTSQHLSHNVLDSFGIMNEKLENANSNSYHELTLDEERILKHQSQKKQKQGEEIIKASNELYNYIENLKSVTIHY